MFLGSCKWSLSLSVQLTQFYFLLHFIVLYVPSVLYLCRQLSILFASLKLMLPALILVLAVVIDT